MTAGMAAYCCVQGDQFDPMKQLDCKDVHAHHGYYETRRLHRGIDIQALISLFEYLSLVILPAWVSHGQRSA